MNRTPGQELCDLFISLLQRIKVMEELLISRADGTRDGNDFQQRWILQTWSGASELKKIAPLFNRMLEQGNALSSSISSPTEKEVLSLNSKRMVTEQQLSSEED